MYLIYFILCDISLILATDSENYLYDVSSNGFNHRSQLEELEIKLLSSHKAKRDTSTSSSAYSEPKIHVNGSEAHGSFEVKPNNGSTTYSEPLHPAINVHGAPDAHTTQSSAIPPSSRTTTATSIKYSVSTGTDGSAPVTNVTTLSAKNASSTLTHQDPFSTQVTNTIDNYTQPLTFEINNETLSKHNLSKTIEDSHIYYNSTRTDDPAIAKQYWVDMSQRPDVTVQGMLSKSHRRAVTVPLPFKFQFYGHEIDNVTIATGGFLYTGDYVHSWLAATQYIAPLMANFDPSLSNNSFIKYVYNDTTFTVLWENVSLQDQPSAGNFTFEVTLKSNGDIIFVYLNIPSIASEITDHYHPVKIGLSDAYILDRTIFFVRRKTIFEYHRVHFDKKDLKNGTVIYLKPLPTCQNKTTCEACLAKDVSFDCQWCDNRCSTGVDRKRHDWVKKECEKKKINETKHCNEKVPMPGAHKAEGVSEKNSSNSTSFIFLSIVAVACVSTALIWTMYAYRNPHSSSGQILIRYRPSQWSSWRKGEARYTAATIHM